jgi:histidine triad (HIT) family protein
MMIKIFLQKFFEKEVSCDVVYEDESCLAFEDISPQAPIHILIIPKGRFMNFDDFHQNATNEMVIKFYKAIQHLIESLNLNSGYRLVTNKGEAGRQTVFHYHVHLLAGEKFKENMIQD